MSVGVKRQGLVPIAARKEPPRPIRRWQVHPCCPRRPSTRCSTRQPTRSKPGLLKRRPTRAGLWHGASTARGPRQRATFIRTHVRPVRPHGFPASSRVVKPRVYLETTTPSTNTRKSKKLWFMPLLNSPLPPKFLAASYRVIRSAFPWHQTRAAQTASLCCGYQQRTTQ